MYQIAKPTPLVDKAYDAYVQWLKIEPNNLEALNNIACLLADNYNPPRASERMKYANLAVSKMAAWAEQSAHARYAGVVADFEWISQ